jgi:predicted nucleic acid-binding protein
MNEAETRAEHIDPALKAAGWVVLDIQEEQADPRALMNRYRNRPMSLADACLVRLSELYTTAEVFTPDSDFRIYRRHGNKVIPALMPD